MNQFASDAHTTPAGRVYLDNAATSYPKPEPVARAVSEYMVGVGASPGRGGYAESRDGSARVADCRRRLAGLLGLTDDRGRPHENHVVFTLNCSDALNLAIKGRVLRVLREKLSGRAGEGRGADAGRGDRSVIHLVTTAMDHNSVLRPFNALREWSRAVGAAFGVSVEWTCVPADPETGLIDPADVAAALRPETVLGAFVHASNVTGVLQPVGEFASVCAERGVPVLLDAAQSAGHVEIDGRGLGVEFVAVPGHKGLMGPLGSGALLIKPGAEALIDTVREGGTGSVSEQDVQPTSMPDRFEPGSHNSPGIVGLGEGLRWIERVGVDALRTHEIELCETFAARLADLGQSGFRLLGTPDPARRVAVFSLVHDELDPHEVAGGLELGFGVLVRAGVHCAPRAHETFGTRGVGAVRLSPGPFTTPAQLGSAIDGLIEIADTSVTPVAASALTAR